MWNQPKNLLMQLKGWLMWLAPVSIFLIAIIGPVYLFKLDFLKFVEVVIWPFTTLTALFFFKEVVTYLFFSMDEFNFFGAKGHLKNVNEVILEEVNKRYSEKESEERRKSEMEKLNNKIKSKEDEISKAQGTADEHLELAGEIMKEWKKSTEQNKKTILGLETENKQLKEIVSSLPSYTSEANSTLVIDDNKTSGPVLEESKINK